ncbi:MAG: FtsQ-type POTRA domain-containing protein [Clostridiales bacterium]|nr:FtsQ-type POTRA domain-containing protein [Clostridiales bacterium]
MPRRKKFYIALSFSAVIMLLVLIMSLPVFVVHTVNVTGLVRLNEQDVINASGLSGDVNFFLASSGRAKKLLARNPYIAAAEVVKVFPNKITVKVSERRLCGYVQDTGNFIYIDGEGRVLEVKENFTEKLPVIVGLNYISYSKGEILEVADKNTFANIMLFANLFETYELEQDIIRVDVKDEDDIRLYIYNIEVKLGSVSDANDKIRYLKAVLPLIPDVETKRGTLDLTSGYKNEAARFRLLT